MDYDFIVVGGGSAGAIIARRLADADIGTVLLLEAGQSDEGDAAILELPRLDEQTEQTEWGFTAFPISGSSQRIQYNRAKMLGGCGNHNDCAFLIPPMSDFELWESTGAVGWGPSGVAPWFEAINQRVQVETSPPVTSVSRAFIDSGIALGLPERNFREAIGPGAGMFPLNANGIFRESSSAAYLHPLAELPDNLTVLCDTRAEKILFDGTRATGCSTSAGEFTANREVILSCGAIQSPQLLAVSGAGPAPILKQLGIPVVADLIGVGSNLIDHTSANVVYKTLEPLPEWEWTLCESTMMLNVNANEPSPDVLYHFVLGVRNKYPDRDNPFPGDSVKISPNVTRPQSRGHLEFVSPSVDDAPLIHLNYLSDPDDYDISTLVKGLRFGRQVANTAPLSDYLGEELAPGPGIVSDQELADYARDTCETVYHPSGTCRMGTDPKSVVSPELKVKGLQNIRVCDASVFPTMVTVNINNTVMMVAEKAAAAIIDEHRA